MKLTRISIENFRSIKSGVINVGDSNAIVGENNSGKSAVLRALNAFFNYTEEEVYFKDGTHQYSPKSLTRITLTFSDIPIKATYQSKIHNNELNIRMTYSYSTHKRTFHCKTTSFVEIGQDFVGELLSDIQFVLIPVARDSNDVVWQENTVLKKVLVEYLKQRTEHRDNLSPKVRDAADMLEKSVFEKVEKELQKYLSSNCNKMQFKIEYSNTNDYNLLLNNIFLNVLDCGQKFNITECGSGLQSLVIVSLYRYLAKLKHNNIILGIEEPEISLHPQAQSQLINDIKWRGQSPNEIQCIITTHSTVMVDELDHEDIILVRKVEDDKRGFRSDITQIPSDFWIRYGLEQFKYYQFFKYKNSDFFFAKFIIVVESKNDAEVFRLLLADRGIKIERYPVSILELGGVDSIKYPYHLLKTLAIPHFIIVDKDYFVPYANGDLDNSRYNSGFPKYKYEYKDTCLIEELIPSKADRDEFLKLLQQNHAKAMDLACKYNFLCLNYCLEIDLVASNTARTLYYQILNVPPNKRNTKDLLVSYKKGIKKIENIIQVLRGVPHKNLPNAYKRIKNTLGDVYSNI